MKLAVVGGGWAGLAAAVRATQVGHQVTLFEMAAQLGGRAREVRVDGIALDNGQHILIGAYQRTLDLMRTVGVDLDAALVRRPLELRYPDGRGLRIGAGPAWLGFSRGVLGAQGWSSADKLALLSAAARWSRQGFRCASNLTVDALCADLPASVRDLLIDPLCVAALNTPAIEASAQVWLQVLRDALFGGRGAADLLLPRVTLGAMLPQPAARWLQSAGARIVTGQRAQRLDPPGPSRAGWQLDGETYDAVVLACTATEAARLCAGFAPDWAAQAGSLRYEPIVTVYLRAPGARLPAPMMALLAGANAPAQFCFDQGALGAHPGVFGFVISGAARWVEVGTDATVKAVLAQADAAFATCAGWPRAPTLLKILIERRATFRCTPRLHRPGTLIAPALVACGDYVAGPYPATLEGAVRSAEAALAAIMKV